MLLLHDGVSQVLVTPIRALYEPLILILAFWKSPGIDSQNKIQSLTLWGTRIMRNTRGMNGWSPPFGRWYVVQSHPRWE